MIFCSKQREFPDSALQYYHETSGAKSNRNSRRCSLPPPPLLQASSRSANKNGGDNNSDDEQELPHKKLRVVREHKLNKIKGLKLERKKSIIVNDDLSANTVIDGTRRVLRNEGTEPWEEAKKQLEMRKKKRTARSTNGRPQTVVVDVAGPAELYKVCYGCC